MTRAGTRRCAVFQSTHPVRGGTKYDVGDILWVRISIHPPREGWD